MRSAEFIFKNTIICFSLLLGFMQTSFAATASTEVGGANRALLKDTKSGVTEKLFVIAVAANLRGEHQASGDMFYQNFPVIEIGYATGSRLYSVNYGNYSSWTGNSSLASTRDVSTLMLLLSQNIDKSKIGNLEIFGGVGAYQEKIISRLYLQSSEELSEWQSQAQLGIRYLFRINSVFYSGPSASLSFAKNFDPNPLLDLSWSLRAGF